MNRGGLTRSKFCGRDGPGHLARSYACEYGLVQAGSLVPTLTYDPLGRRISKKVENSGDWNATYHYYYNGWSMIETRNNSGQVLAQLVLRSEALLRRVAQVWGTQYIDELAQTAADGDVELVIPAGLRDVLVEPNAFTPAKGKAARVEPGCTGIHFVENTVGGKPLNREHVDAADGVVAFQPPANFPPVGPAALPPEGALHLNRPALGPWPQRVAT